LYSAIFSQVRKISCIRGLRAMTFWKEYSRRIWLSSRWFSAFSRSRSSALRSTRTTSSAAKGLLR